MPNKRARDVSSFRTYRVLVSLGIVSAVAELAYGIMNQSAIPPYVQELGLTAHIGVIYAAFLVSETIFKSPLGSLGDRIGRRPIIVFGALISSASAFGMTLVHQLWGLISLRILDGLAAGAIWPTMVAAIGGSVPPGRRTSGMSVLTVTYIAGLAVGPLIGGVANDYTDSRLTSFYVISALFLMTAIAAIFLIPQRSKEDLEAIKKGRRQVSFSDVMLGLKSVPDMMVVAFLAFFAVGLCIPIVKLFVMNELGMSETGYGGLMLPAALIVAAASLVAGRLGDHWGKATSVRLGIGVSMLAMWVVTIVREPWELAVAGAFIGIGFVLAMPAWLALVSDMAAPWIRGAVIGGLGTAQGIGGVMGAAAGSYLYNLATISFFGIGTNSHYSPFVVSAFSLTACTVLALIFIRAGGKKTDWCLIRTPRITKSPWNKETP
ncbi:MAG TPA: MFS transporter [Armatimonadota bacterium]|nr:MFS transporter [Armatimonadota bacterium]